MFASGGTRIRVTGQRVNLRSAGTGRASIVHVVSNGDELVAVKGLNGDWVAVKVPSDAGLWVYGELVRDGVVSVPKLDARSGAGIDSQIICHLKEGDKVNVTGRSGDWLKIEPPSDCVFYINSKYVEPVRSSVKKTVPVKKVAPVKKVVDRTPPKPAFRPLVRAPVVVVPPVVSRPRPPAPSISPSSRYGNIFPEERLIASRDQGEKVVYDGELRKSGLLHGCPGGYSLSVRDDKGRVLTRCYVKGNNAQLTSLLGRTLRIEGSEYWLRGVRLSVIVPDRIVPTVY